MKIVLLLLGFSALASCIPVSRLDSIECEACKVLVKGIEDALASKTTQGDIANALDKFCELLPKDDQAECKEYMAEFVPEAVQYLDQLLPELCTKALGCPNAAKLLEAITLQNNEVQALAAVNPLRITCFVCEFLIKLVEQAINTQQTYNATLEDAYNFCQDLPIGGDKCLEIVEQLLPTLFTLAPGMLNKICPQLLGCKTQNMVLATEALDCKLCGDLSQALEQILNDPEMKAQAKEALSHICYMMPGKAGSQCNTIVDKYFPQIIQYLEQMASNLCPELGCPNALQLIGNDEENKVVCDLCEAIVQALQKTITSTSTVQDMEDEVNKACEKLPLKTLTAICEQMGKIIIEQYIVTLGPFALNLVCPMAFKCTGDSVYFKPQIQADVLKQSLISQPLNLNLGCDVCQDVRQGLQQVIDNAKFQADVKTVVLHLCSELGPYSTECTTLVNEYLPMVFQILDDAVSGNICKDIGICPSVSKLIRRHHFGHHDDDDDDDFHAVPQRFDLTCDLCQDVVTALKQVVDDASVQADIKQALDSICDALPSLYTGECKTLVNDYLPQIFQSLDQFLPKACSELGFCSSTGFNMNLLKFITKPLRLDAKCEVCAVVINMVKQAIDNPTTQAEIKEKLLKICSVMPEEYVDECDNIINKYLPIVFQELDLILPIPNVCSGYFNCTSAIHTVQKRSTDDTVGCTVCNLIITVLKDFLLDPNTVNAILGEVEKICDVLPADLRKTCDELLQNYLPALIKYASDALDKACPDIFGCQSVGPQVLTMNHTTDLSLSCDLCEGIVDVLKQLLNDKDIQTQLVQSMEKACDDLPASLQATCKDLVKQYLPQIIQYVDGELDKACADLFQCPSLQKVAEFMKHMSLRTFGKPQQFGIQSVACDSCYEVLDVIKYFLNKPLVQKELEAYLDQVCAAIPDQNLANACKQTVNEYMPEIIDYINNKLLNKQLCNDILHCTSSTSFDTKDFSICETLKEIYNEIPKIIDEAQGVCAEIPVLELQQACNEAFQKYKPQIINIGHEAVKWVADHIPFVHCDITQFTQLASSSNGAVCEACEILMEILSDQIEQKWAEDDLKKLLDEGCDLIPDKFLADACKSAIDDFIGKITKWISDNIVTPKLCWKYLHCDTFDALAKGLSVCDVLKEVHTALPEIVSDAEAGCDEIPDDQLKQACHQVFQKYKPQIIQIADHGLKWFAAHMPIGHCSLGENVEVLSVKSVACDVCDGAIDVLKFYLNQPAVQGELKNLLRSACNEIPDKALADACQETVDQFLPEIIQYIDTNILNDQLCTDILNCGGFETVGTEEFSICNAFQKLYLEMPKIMYDAIGVCNVIPDDLLRQSCYRVFHDFFGVVIKGGQNVVKFVADHIPFAHCTIGDQQLRVQRSIPETQLFNIGCDVCDGAADVLKYFLGDEDVRRELKGVFIKGCRMIPNDELKDACEETVTRYSNEIFGFIDDDILPKLCAEILGCSNGTTTPQFWGFSICGIFEAIYKDVPWLVGYSEKVCDVIPDKNLSSKCKQTFEEYAPILIEIFKQVFSEVVDHIPFLHCKLTPNLLKHNFPRTGFFSLGCDLCDGAIDVLKYFLGLAPTQNTLKGVLIKSCDLIPKADLRDACKETVTKYTKEIFDYIDSGILPKVCPDILGCSSSLSELNSFSICNVLEAIYKDVAKLVGYSEGVCDVIPDKRLSDACKQTFEEYAPILVEIFEQFLQGLADIIPFVHCKLGPVLLQQKEMIKIDICGTLQDLYHHIPEIPDYAGMQLCPRLSKVLQEPCQWLFTHERETIITVVDGLMKKVVAEIPFLGNCKMGPYSTPNSEQYTIDQLNAITDFLCGTLQDLYHHIRLVIDDAETSLCGLLPQGLRMPCKDLIDEEKDNLVNIIQSLLKKLTAEIPFLKNCKLGPY